MDNKKWFGFFKRPAKKISSIGEGRVIQIRDLITANEALLGNIEIKIKQGMSNPEDDLEARKEEIKSELARLREELEKIRKEGFQIYQKRGDEQQKKLREKEFAEEKERLEERIKKDQEEFDRLMEKESQLAARLKEKNNLGVLHSDPERMEISKDLLETRNRLSDLQYYITMLGGELKKLISLYNKDI